tara:strand:- start:2195 stop:2560 length:366 start_codon:yes stop_codon:yes gene_type:complete
MPFHKGQRVVAVELHSLLEKGRVYTVDETGPTPGLITLEGWPGTWLASRFCPVDREAIVVRVVDGALVPASKPMRHESMGVALVEAERLARNQPGTEYLVLEIVSTSFAERVAPVVKTERF